MVRPDSIAPNEVQILMPLVSGLTARESFGRPVVGEVSRTQDAAFMGETEYRFSAEAPRVSGKRHTCGSRITKRRFV
jgi:hypothetical protein